MPLALHSTYEQFGLPGHVGEIFFLVSLALTLSPYFAGVDFGIIKVPALPIGTQKLLKLVGPFLLAVSVFLFFPLWHEPPTDYHFRSADRSPEAEVVRVVFKNSSSRYLNLDWLDSNGRPDSENHHPLEPGKSQEVRTFAGHAWRFLDANTGVTLKTVVIASNTRLVEYREFSGWFWSAAAGIVVISILMFVWSRLASRSHRAPPSKDSTDGLAKNAESKTLPQAPNRSVDTLELPKDDYPYGAAIPGKPGFVKSPYAPDQGLVDVRGFSPGTKVKDPFTSKIFRVPPQVT